MHDKKNVIKAQWFQIYFKEKTFHLTLLESALFESTDCKCFNKYMNVYLYLMYTFNSLILYYL